MKIIVIRHGQTDWNVEEKLQGVTDIPLNSEGIRQAEIAREIINNIDFDMIICSTLKRTIQTTKIISKDKNVPIKYDERITERNYGILEGLKTDEINFDEYFEYYKNKPCKDGESIQVFFDRIYKFLDDVKENYKDYNKILLVTHGDVVRAIKCYFNGIPNDGNVKNLIINNCEIIEFEFNKVENK